MFKSLCRFHARVWFWLRMSRLPFEGSHLHVTRWGNEKEWKNTLNDYVSDVILVWYFQVELLTSFNNFSLSFRVKRRQLCLKWINMVTNIYFYTLPQKIPPIKTQEKLLCPWMLLHPTFLTCTICTVCLFDCVWLLYSWGMVSMEITTWYYVNSSSSFSCCYFSVSILT